MFLLISLLLILALAYGHSPVHVVPAPDCKAAPAVLSYHIHIVFTLTSSTRIEAAGALREKAISKFGKFLGKNPACEGTPEDRSGRYDNGRLCVIYDHPINETLIGGPFPAGEWSIFVPVHYYGLVVPWFAQNHGDFSLLVHPNTGCEFEDHSDWALWSGAVWPLDMTIFKQYTQTNEFNQHPGSSENPICLSGGVCSTSEYFNIAQVGCCDKMECVCLGSDSCRCL